ncbi:MAG TPA: cytochrome c3 family protein, partial [Polyangiaceae bacterium]
LELDGSVYGVARRGDEVVATLPGEGERPFLLVTGSHNYEGFWVRGQREGELRMFPFVYLFREARWIARRDVFLQPPDAPAHAARWNSNCIQCHSVAGRPGHDEELDRFRTRTAELGIACEACHGPGGPHVRKQRDPLTRYASHGQADTTIVEPRRLDAERASSVCGQCHAYAFPRDEGEWWENGYSARFRPGDALGPSRVLLFYEELGKTGSPVLEASLESLYWSDGTIRVGGREYNGLARSPCFERGQGERKLSCLSCHSMHASEPEDQLRQDRTGNEVCLACHEGLRKVTAHTHHAEGGVGSQCVACHMPKTTYALLKAIRSHRIESPSVPAAVATGRPTACNLCHLDRTLRWTDDALVAWFGRPRTALDGDAERVPASVIAVLRGNAAVRALVAANLGDPESLAASGSDWERPILDRLAQDPYAAVRLIASRSAQALPAASRTPPLVDGSTLDALVLARDDRAITISE